MDASLDTNFPTITDGVLSADLNEDGTHVYVTRYGRMTRRGPQRILVGWVELTSDLRQQVTDYRHAESFARYGDERREAAADALEDALRENVLEYLAGTFSRNGTVLRRNHAYT